MIPGWALATRAPFHLEATVRVLQRRPSNAVDVWHQGRYRRLLSLPNGPALVEVENRGSIADPEMRFCIREGKTTFATRAAVRRALCRMLGLDVDPAPLWHLTEAERTFHNTARALRGMRPPRFASLFEAFASVIPFQQLSLDAGVAIVGRLVAKFGEHLVYDSRRCYAFPTAHSIASARLASLRACGLSARKAQTLHDVARAVESDGVTEARLSGMSTNEALRTLIAMPGIGPWSAGLVLLRGLGRLDVFPPGDIAAKRGVRALMRRGSQAPLEPIIERFGEHRGYLYFCALGGSLLSKGLIHAAPDWRP
ncbi:MAG: AlkA N-terminal domain-containing protein [Pseudomonadota bacterium]